MSNHKLSKKSISKRSDR